MHFLVVTDVYPPEPLTSARIARDVAHALVERGHSVEVVAPFPNRPAGVVLDGSSRRPIRRHRDGELTVTNTWHTLSRQPTLWSRGAENLSFGLTSSAHLARTRRADAAYVNTWPLGAQLLNSLALRARSIPMICVVKDLYPETLTGTERHDIAMRALQRVDASVYRRSEHVLTITEAQRRLIVEQRGIDAERVHVVPDWFEIEAPSVGAGAAFRAHHDIDDDAFVASYVGSLTRQAGLDTLVSAARELRSSPELVLVVNGDGAERTRLESILQREELPNLRLITPLDPADVPAAQAAADLLVVSLVDGVATTTLPSKIISYLHSARPIVAAVSQQSEAARFVRDADVGVVCPPGDGSALAAAISDLARDSDRRERLGLAAAEAAGMFDRDSSLERICRLLELVGGREAG